MITSAIFPLSPPNSFSARYSASSLGRLLTPDCSSSPEPIPYANLENPQSLNLYSYVLNNPASDVDPDGHGEVLDFFAAGSEPISFKTDAEYAAWLNVYGHDDVSLPPVGQSGTIYANVYDGPIAVGYATYIPDPVTVSSFLLAPAKSFYTHFVDLFLNENPRAIPGLLFAMGSAVAPEGGAAAAAPELLDEAANSGAQNPKLIRTIRELFRSSDSVPGGTAGAVRQELATGLPTRDKFHSVKAINSIARLQNLLNGGVLSENDANIARALIRDLENALRGGGQ